jgi:hypothetical protein
LRYHFCTYFDSNYLCQGVTLYRSLRRQNIDFKLYVACLDERAFDTIARLQRDCPELEPVKLVDIEAFDPEFHAVKSNRSRIEYYFTLSPVLPLFLFNRYPEIDILGYLDADLLFYSSPQPIYYELGQNSLLIIEHRFPECIRYREKFGRFNVQCQLYRNDSFALACLRDWRERCIEWCSDKFDGERFADQKYLDQWPEKFKKLVILQNTAAGLAPWNWYNYTLKIMPDNTMTVDGTPLIFYHFQGFKRLNSWILNHGLGHYGAVMPSNLLQWFYAGYMRELNLTYQWLNNELKMPDISLPWRNNRTGFSKFRAILSGIKHRGLMWYRGNG